MKEIIRLESIVKIDADGRRILGGVSLCVQKGERVRILGVPGSGKTALVRLIAGMDRPDSGTIFVLGEPVHEMTEDKVAAFRNKYIGYIPRTPMFWNELTVLDNVTLPLTIKGVSESKRAKAGKEQLDMLGLMYAAHACPMRLSSFELRLAAVARALIPGPEILLLNEMLAGLTGKEASKLAETLAVLWNFGDYTILTLTGNNNDANQADRQVCLDHGKIREEKP